MCQVNTQRAGGSCTRKIWQNSGYRSRDHAPNQTPAGTSSVAPSYVAHFLAESRDLFILDMMYAGEVGRDADSGIVRAVFGRPSQPHLSIHPFEANVNETSRPLYCKIDMGQNWAFITLSMLHD